MSELDFVFAAYAATGVGLAAIALLTVWRAAHWARRARELEKK